MYAKLVELDVKFIVEKKMSAFELYSQPLGKSVARNRRLEHVSLKIYVNLDKRLVIENQPKTCKYINHVTLVL